jgi:hypothetical protein
MSSCPGTGSTPRNRFAPEFDSPYRQAIGRRNRRQVQAAVWKADAAVHDYVDVLRRRGISWTRIGAALGVSKQAACERFSGED